MLLENHSGAGLKANGEGANAVATTVTAEGKRCESG
jgi:hypothetical protein